MKKKNYKFTAYGKSFWVLAKDNIINAYATANKELLWKSKEFKEGAWFCSKVDENEEEYYWAEGNFFD